MENDKAINKITTLLVVIILVLIGIIVYIKIDDGKVYKESTEINNNDSEKDEIIEDDVLDDENSTFSVKLSKIYGIEYIEERSTEKKVTESDTIFIDFDSDYVDSLNEKYAKLSVENLNRSILLTNENISEYAAKFSYTVDEFREYAGAEVGMLYSKTSYKINYYTHNDVASIVSTTSTGGFSGSYVKIDSDNINLHTGEMYSNKDLLALIYRDETFALSAIKEQYLSDKIYDYPLNIDDVTLFLKENTLYAVVYTGAHPEMFEIQRNPLY